MEPAIAVIAGYVLGSMPWGLWIPRVAAGVDIRSVGSGNTGATNVWRTLGFRYGLGVALLDIGKGAAAASLGHWLAGDPWGVLAGAAAVVGHYRPLFLGFARGGKIVATTGGVMLALAPLAALCAAGVWIAVFLATRYASVASILGAVSLPAFTVVFDEPVSVTAFASAAALGIIVLHRQNIQRLIAGTENRITFRSGKRAAEAGAAPRTTGS